MQTVALRTVKAVGRLSPPTSLSLFPVQKCRKMSVGSLTPAAGKRRPSLVVNDNSSRLPESSASHASTSGTKHKAKSKTTKGRKEAKQALKEAPSFAEEEDFIEDTPETPRNTLSKGKGVLRETDPPLSKAASAWKDRLKGAGSSSSSIPVEDISTEEEYSLSKSSNASSTSTSLPNSSGHPPYFTKQDKRPAFLGSEEAHPPPQPPEQLEVDVEDKDEDDLRQPESIPLPKEPMVPRFKTDGISAARAARTYLRVQGLAGLAPQNTTYHILDWILRHAARDLGYEIVPDGFVRISELLTFELFSAYNYDSFAEMCAGNPRFEVVELPDVVDGMYKDVRWVRARKDHTIPGVLSSNKRILNMGKLQTVVYRAPYEQWEQIQQKGIVEGHDRTIRLYQKGKAFYYKNRIPRSRRLVCITLDAEKAARLGVMFFHTDTIDLLAVGKGGYIPWECVRTVLELELTKEQLTF